MATPTKYDRNSIQVRRLFGEDIPETPFIEERDTFTVATPAGPVQTARPTRAEPTVQKFFQDEEGNLIGESEASEELKQTRPSSVVIPKPSRDLSRPEVQEAIKDFYTGKGSATGGDWIDLESPMATMVRGQQEAITRAKEPTALEKKFGEMGLEYDYSKRRETGTVRIQEEEDPDKIVEQENPDFVRRNRDFDNTINLVDQLEQQYNFKKGQLEALELSIYANRDYASSNLGRQRMGLIRQEQQQLDALYQAETAKLDGQFYEQLPDRDMAVANVLLNQGLTGKRMSRMTTNHGNIRDTIDTLALQVPEGNREEFRTKLLGDYVRDDQGNIVRNATGEELRKGGDLVSLTPYGTYDYKVSPVAYTSGIQQLVKQYGGGTEGSLEDTLKSYNTRISAVRDFVEDLDTPEDEANLYKPVLQTLLKERADLVVGRTPTATPTEAITETELAETTIEPTKPVELSTEDKINTLINDGLAEYNKFGELVSLTDNPNVITSLVKLKNELRKK